MSETVQHQIGPDGESTEKWAIRSPGFLGSIQQLTRCARCGCNLPPRKANEPRRFRDIFKPTLHVICDECFEALPA